METLPFFGLFNVGKIKTSLLILPNNVLMHKVAKSRKDSQLIVQNVNPEPSRSKDVSIKMTVLTHSQQ